MVVEFDLIAAVDAVLVDKIAKLYNFWISNSLPKRCRSIAFGYSFQLCFRCRVVKAVHDTEFEGSKIHAKVLSNEQRTPSSSAPSGNKRPTGPGGRQIDFPLRVLVQSEMVGAIIGRGGQTIRQITQQTR